jgi:MoxR-like ATPase
VNSAGLENDEYVRQIDGYLPTAEVAFIDEIFKANSAILNALLTLLNERLFDNGNKRFPVPLLCLVRRWSASINKILKSHQASDRID